MKKLIQNISVLAALSLAFTVNAQSDEFRSAAPAAGPARTIEIGESEKFTLDNGLTVIVVENHKVPRISYQLFIDRDAIVEGEKAGYVQMAGSLLSTGSTTRTKAEIDEAIDFVGGSMSSSSRGGFASSLTKHSEVVLEVFADVILNPSFQNDQFEKIKTQTISGLQSNKDDPNAISGNVSGGLNYGLDHPYGEMMTETTVENIILDDCIMYYNTYFKPNAAYIVVVGDITAKKAKKSIEQYFGAWEKGDIPQHEYDMPASPEGTDVAFVDKAGAVQSVINISHVVDLKPGQDDAIPARVMNSILGSGFSGRLFQNLREEKAYTYGAYSSIGNDELVATFTASASVRNEVTDSAITEFMYELNRMRDTDVTDKELDLAKNFIAGSFARNLESPQTVARFALNTYRYDLDADYYSKYLERLDAVDVAAVRAMAQKYIHPDNARIIVVGNKDEVSESLVPFSANGKVTFYDIYAKEMAPAVDAGDVSGEDVIVAYIDAIGGKDKLAGITSMKITRAAEAMGQKMEFVDSKMAPGMYSGTMSMQGSVIMVRVCKGDAGYMEQQGQRMEMEGDELKAIQDEAKLFPELDYLGVGYTLEVSGIEEVNGESAYKLNVTTPDGKSNVEYYSVETGYKLRSIATVEANGETTNTTADLSDYREVNGIMFAYSQNLTGFAPFPIELKTSSVELNVKLDPTIFE